MNSSIPPAALLLCFALTLCAHAAPETSEATEEGSTTNSILPYPLSTCVVSGEKLGEMGDPIVFTHENQEIKLCCKMCKKKFQKAPEDYLPKLEVKPYPLTTCIVTDEDLGSMGDAVSIIHEGQELKFCCNGCIKKFNADPDTYLKKLEGI